MTTNNEWWRGAVIYQVYPRSFLDTNGDGIGDLTGIAQKMPYLSDLGVDAVWLSPFFTSPMKDFGYDISDYCGVDPMFGTLVDFDKVVSEAHKAGLKLIIDQVYSHTSDRHPWFVESRRDRTNPKANWYVWADAREDGSPPNNWLSNFGGVSWEWDTRRRQYYLHNFLTSQPDLNFHNPQVRQAVLDVMKFWLDRGVDGFRLDVVNYYYHDASLKNNPPNDKNVEYTNVDPSNPYAHQRHLHDKNQPENLMFLEDMRRLVDTYPKRMLLGEMGVETQDADRILGEYTENGKRLNMAYAFELMTRDFSAARIRKVVERLSPKAGWMCWSFSNHDVVRVISRWGLADNADRAAPLVWSLLLSLRGSPCVYNGEELGLTEADVPFDLLQDPYGIAMWPENKGRDGCRTPMPWSGGDANAGFTTGTPWLPVPAEHRQRAVDVQSGNPDSILSKCRRFTKWRKSHPEFVTGDIVFIDAPGDVLAFRRGDNLVAMFNLSGGPVEFSLPRASVEVLDGHGFAGTVSGDKVMLNGFDAAFCRL